MTDIRRNEIYFAEIQFSDSNETKKRPVIILSNNNYNKEEPDVITCGVSSNIIHRCHFPIVKSDLSYGNLFLDAGVRVDMINKTSKKRLLVKIGKITDDFHKRLVERIVELIG